MMHEPREWAGQRVCSTCHFSPQPGAMKPVPWPCAEVQNREFRSLLECTEFALEWLILYHVIEDGGADWKSKFDGSPFFKCDCSESGGYMEWDTNAYIHTERCASGFEDSLPALHDQIKAALERRRPSSPAPSPALGAGEGEL